MKTKTVTRDMIFKMHDIIRDDDIISDAPMPQALYKRMLKISPVWAHQLRYRIATLPHIRTRTPILSRYFEPSDSLRKKYSQHGKEVPTVLTYSAVHSCFLGEAPTDGPAITTPPMAKIAACATCFPHH